MSKGLYSYISSFSSTKFEYAYYLERQYARGSQLKNIFFSDHLLDILYDFTIP